jgi:hypothetical protein
MFDLNRQINQEDPTVVVFNEKNSNSALSKILKSSPVVEIKYPVQQSMI